ncbi:MAG: hypothetical protein ACKV2T_02915 [Kofleriaceae bacterium]
MRARYLVFIVMVGCGDGETKDQCYPPTVDVARCDPALATFSLASTNPYYPLRVGNVTILEGVEDGQSIRVERRVLADTEVVKGVTTHVLEARELIDGQIYEIARNYYVEAYDGTVCYFGEAVEFYENGQLVNRNGSWRADEGNAKPGVIMPAAPAVGDAYFQENAPGIAIDMGRVTDVTSTMMFAGQSYDNVVTVMDSNPLDTCDDEEVKFYVPGIGESGDTAKLLVSFTPGA